MVSTGHLLAFAGVAALIIAIPGPSVVFTISRALTHGRRVALLNVAGNSLGLAVQVVTVAFGLGNVVQRSAEVFTIVKLAGAAYLIYLGAQAVRHRHSLAEAVGSRLRALSPLEAVRDGAVVGATNPKTIAFMVALLPEFAVPATGHLPAQLLALGMLFPLIALVLDSVWAFAAGTVRQWLSSSPRRLAVLGGAGGLAMIGIGVSLAATGRKD
jgi:threonine/homoserine/homoserine lactone efflux protein